MTRIFSTAAILAALAAVAHAENNTATTQPASTQPASTQTTVVVDPVANQILHECSDFLAQSKAFAVHAEIWKDQVLPSGFKVQVTRSVDVAVRRPDRFHIDARAHHKGRSIWYDGKSITVLERQSGLYGVVSAPPSSDEAIELLANQYNISVPLEDLAVADPYADAMKGVTAGGYFGDEMVLGVSCRHIGFSTDRIDWQLWIADGPQPLPQKLVITYKNEDQSPQFIAIFSKWNTGGRASDLAFQFIPPPGSSQIPLKAQAEHEKGRVRHEKD